MNVNVTRTLLCTACFVLSLGFVSSASAEVKAYSGDVLPGDFLSNGADGPTNDLGILKGGYLLDDAATGTVTIDSYSMEIKTSVNFDATVAFGPGGFLFATENSTRNVSPGHTGTGSTLTSVTWGVVAGWSATGGQFCSSSPTSACAEFAAGPHGLTSPLSISSVTYDLGTWNFDAAGDFTAAAPYDFETTMGGTGNGQFLLRGALQGPALPALPLVGFGALGVALLVGGARMIVRKR